MMRFEVTTLAIKAAVEDRAILQARVRRCTTPNGLYPFVQLHTHSGQPLSQAQASFAEITAVYEERERERRRAEQALSPRRGPRFELRASTFRTQPRYSDFPSAADIASCVAALAQA